MLKILIYCTLLLFFAHSLSAQSLTIGASGNYARSLGYDPTYSIWGMIENKLTWQTYRYLPLSKVTINGGHEVDTKTEIKAYRFNRSNLTANHIVTLTPVIYVNRQFSDVWNKTTVRIGGGVRYHNVKDDMDVWGNVSKTVVSPNEGFKINGGVQFNQGRWSERLDMGLIRYNQPFTVPMQYGLWGSYVDLGIGFRLVK